MRAQLSSSAAAVTFGEALVAQLSASGLVLPLSSLAFSDAALASIGSKVPQYYLCTHATTLVWINLPA